MNSCLSLSQEDVTPVPSGAQEKWERRPSQWSHWRLLCCHKKIAILGAARRERERGNVWEESRHPIPDMIHVLSLRLLLPYCLCSETRWVWLATLQKDWSANRLRLEKKLASDISLSPPDKRQRKPLLLESGNGASSPARYIRDASRKRREMWQHPKHSATRLLALKKRSSITFFVGQEGKRIRSLLPLLNEELVNSLTT